MAAIPKKIIYRLTPNLFYLIATRMKSKQKMICHILSYLWILLKRSNCYLSQALPEALPEALHSGDLQWVSKVGI